MTINTCDRQTIEDIIARYCWLIDAGDGEQWADLWTHDGKFTGIPVPLEGREQLQAMPKEFHAMGNGKFRHLISNITVSEADGVNDLLAKGYSLLSNWSEGGAIIGFASAAFTFTRTSAGWKIKALHAEMLG